MRVAALTISVIAILFAGCGRSETVHVTGTITLNGQSVDQAEVIFMPQKGRVASGVTDKDGRFALATNKPGDGAVPGEHVVTVGEYYPPGKPPPMSGGPPPRIPLLYTTATESPLRAKVERGAKNDFSFDVKK